MSLAAHSEQRDSSRLPSVEVSLSIVASRELKQVEDVVLL